MPSLSRAVSSLLTGGPTVVPRKPKLIAASAVLAVGLGLAWPWRRGDSVPAMVLPISTPSTSFGSVPAPWAEPMPGSAPTAVSATTIGLSGSPPQHGLASAGLLPQLMTVAKPVQIESGQPSPFGNEATVPPPAAAEERTHVVHAGDSLERLAQRYLGDEGRAIEIFDLNRQVLENPHLLPIGAELMIPFGADATGSASAP